MLLSSGNPAASINSKRKTKIRLERRKERRSHI